MGKKRVKICIVGWHFLKTMYKPLSKCQFDVHVVAHRHNDILDNFGFNYSVIKNVGLEYGAYDYYIKNIWDKKSDVIFMHDDGELKNNKAIDNIVNRYKHVDIGYVLGATCNVKRKTSTRCFYLSSTAISLFLKKFGGIGFDANDRGYTLGLKEIYDKELDAFYTDKIDIARNFKIALKKMVDKYGLSKAIFSCKDIIFHVRGVADYKKDKMFMVDNTVFGRKETNPMEEIAQSYNVDMNRNIHFYTKWYNFCFSSIRLDNLNILRLGAKNSDAVKIWNGYFKNSDIYEINENDVPGLIDKILYGVDIVIDDGTLEVDRLSTFKLLFDKLNPAGIYVMENLQNAYGNDNSLLSFVKELIDSVNYHGKAKGNNFEKIIKEQSFDMGKYERIVTAIHSYPGIVFIFKRFCK